MSTIQRFEGLIGKTFVTVTAIKEHDHELRFVDRFGQGFRFYHSQDCCESVEIADVIGDLADLEMSPIVEAEEISHEGQADPPNAESGCFTWTFYRFSTAKGTVTVRWLGESNGYYSESVDFGPLQ